MVKKCCARTNPDLGLLLIRFALALVFIIHGLAKFQAMPDTIAFFGTFGLVPFMAYFVAAVELFGGIMLLLGMFTPWTAIVLGVNMFFAIFLVKLGKPFLGGYEYDLTLMLTSFGVSLLGTGKYSVCPCGKEKKS